MSLARDAAKSKPLKISSDGGAASRRDKGKAIPQHSEAKKQGQSIIANDNNTPPSTTATTSTAVTTTVVKEKLIAPVVTPLPAEPAVGSPDSIHVVVRLPTGRVERRFHSHDSIGTVFRFVDEALRGTDLANTPYSLVTTLPRVVYSRQASKDTSLQQGGFQPKMALIYEGLDDDE